jgi:hypothetical protein
MVSLQSSSQPKFHPQFASPEADFVLTSSDDPPILFRVPSFTLRIASQFFKEILIARGSTTRNGDADTDDQNDLYFETKKPARLLLPFLQMISALPVSLITVTDAEAASLPQIYTHVTSLLHLCKLYSAPGPVSQIKAALQNPLFLTDPIRLYYIACTFSWEEERKWALAAIVSGVGGCANVWTIIESGINTGMGSESSLVSNGGDYDKADSNPMAPPSHAQLLLALNPSIHLTRLLLLHRKRRDGLRSALDSHKHFVESSMNDRLFSCPGCAQRAAAERRTAQQAEADAAAAAATQNTHHAPTNTIPTSPPPTGTLISSTPKQSNWEWRDLKNAMVLDFERRSDGGAGMIGKAIFDPYKGVYDTLRLHPAVPVTSQSSPSSQSPISNDTSIPTQIQVQYSAPVTGRPGTVEEWVEGKTCWDAVCTRDGCGWPKYDKTKVLKALADCLRVLPTEL